MCRNRSKVTTTLASFSFDLYLTFHRICVPFLLCAISQYLVLHRTLENSSNQPFITLHKFKLLNAIKRTNQNIISGFYISRGHSRTTWTQFYSFLVNYLPQHGHFLPGKWTKIGIFSPHTHLLFSKYVHN